MVLSSLHKFIMLLLLVCWSIPAQATENSLVTQVDQLLLNECGQCQKIWEELKQYGIVHHSSRDPVFNRHHYTVIQHTFEKTLLHALRNKQITSVVSIIHAPHAPTPLRVGDSDILSGALPKEILLESGYIDRLRLRYHTLLEYLEAGGTLISLHLHYKKPENVAGYHRYLALCSQYPNLLDFEASSIPVDYSGATYFVLQKNKQMLIFSIMGPQATVKSAAAYSWAMWLGEPRKNPIIAKRAVKMDSFFKGHNIDVYEILGMAYGG